jgi:hypothetical protein
MIFYIFGVFLSNHELVFLKIHYFFLDHKITGQLLINWHHLRVMLLESQRTEIRNPGILQYLQVYNG